mmetsp:Transcript_7791/g.24012  ORF Transcript_7791/g.24012 Transcript_7791/m.24012 type:complete len:736 (+) Transcript_7791:79-2286(+)
MAASPSTVLAQSTSSSSSKDEKYYGLGRALNPSTDLRRWKLDVKEGRQSWRFVEQQADYVQSVVEKYLVGLDTAAEAPVLPKPKTALEAARNGVKFWEKIQCEDGHWPNDYGGPMFLMPGLIFTSYISAHQFAEEQVAEMIRYMFNLQAEDGGWGLHIECKSNIFGTSLQYVACRLLGVPADHPRMVKARQFLHDNGGATGIPSWGKFWLATLGVYEWDGLNPVPPELWLLPDWVPFHPGRWWCHCRVVYLPMGYIYGRRATGPITPLIQELRKELYTTPYKSIDWPAQRHNVNPLDMYSPHHPILKFFNTILYAYEKRHNVTIRKKALDLTLDHIRSENENTNYICIGPVNKVINMLAIWYAEGDSPAFRKHCDRVDDYLWLGTDGMKMQGYNGSQLWDTAFTIQAIIETGLGNEFEKCLQKSYEFLDLTQVREDVPTPEKYYRHISKGAWPFSTRDHGWPISDCTAEGLRAALLLNQYSFIKPLTKQRYFDAVNVILSLQNKSGGWATYELKRGPDAVEILNAAEVFYGIMVDYPYVECTSACVQTLVMFRTHFPYHRPTEVNQSIRKGAQFLKKIQRPDGSWIGSWAVCFTYGTWFGVEGLIAAGESVHSPAIRKACEFLISKQRSDGGWGETFDSCVTRNWSENTDSQVVNTAWCVLTLLAAEWDLKPIRRAIRFLIERQLPNGDWQLQDVSGVFNANCSISYNGYKNIFPIWALGRYAYHERYQPEAARL